MIKRFNQLRKEDGSATIEFLGIVPLVFLLILIFWQFAVGIHGIIVAQSAANEYAKVYSVTKNASEARAAADEIMSTASDSISYSASVSGGKEFKVDLQLQISFVILPDALFGGGEPTVSYSTSARGRVIE